MTSTRADERTLDAPLRRVETQRFGVPVVIYGGNFTPDARVWFGSVEAGAVTFISSSVIEVTSPPDAAAEGVETVVNVQVVNPVYGSAVTSSDQYTYVTPP